MRTRLMSASGKCPTCSTWAQRGMVETNVNVDQRDRKVLWGSEWARCTQRDPPLSRALVSRKRFLLILPFGDLYAWEQTGQVHYSGFQIKMRYSSSAIKICISLIPRWLGRVLGLEILHLGSWEISWINDNCEGEKSKLSTLTNFSGKKFQRYRRRINPSAVTRSVLEDETISNEWSYRCRKQLEAVSKIDGSPATIFIAVISRSACRKGAEFYRRMRSAELRAR